ncbi:unnamed protein product [Aphanomyces euteiches]
MSLYDSLMLPGELKSSTLALIQAKQRENTALVQSALEEMHKEMSSVNAAKRDKARKLRAQKRGVEMTQFVIGDFVLYQDVWYHLREKLRTKWCGPAEVVKVTSD